MLLSNVKFESDLQLVLALTYLFREIECYSQWMVAGDVSKKWDNMWLNILKGTSCRKTRFWVMAMQRQNISLKV